MKTNDSVLCADLTLLDLIHYRNFNSIPRNVHTTNTQLPNYETVNCICSAYERGGGGGGGGGGEPNSTGQGPEPLEPRLRPTRPRSWLVHR